MSWMDGGWSSHLEALAWALPQTWGPIVEMGAGWYSTPLLHGYAAATERELFTVDDPQHWEEDFNSLAATYETAWHSFERGTYQLPVVDMTDGGLVFIDHGTVWRAPSLWEAKNAGARIIVVHDTEPTPGKDEEYPGMATALASFKYRLDFTVYPQWTTVLSDVIDLRGDDDEAERGMVGGHGALRGHDPQGEDGPGEDDRHAEDDDDRGA